MMILAKSAKSAGKVLNIDEICQKWLNGLEN